MVLCGVLFLMFSVFIFVGVSLVLVFVVGGVEVLFFENSWMVMNSISMVIGIISYFRSLLLCMVDFFVVGVILGIGFWLWEMYGWVEVVDCW